MRSQHGSGSDLPAWVTEPGPFHRLLNQKLTDLIPWHLMSGAEMAERHAGLQRRFPQRELWPFARRQDNDDVACWEKNQPAAVVVIHDFTSPGHEQRRSFSSFWDWFRFAIEEMIEFEP
jgi:hypothetical protein